MAYVNQSDWRAKHLVNLVRIVSDDEGVKDYISKVQQDFDKVNAKRLKQNGILVPETDLEALLAIGSISPLQLGVIDAADNWVVETQREAGRLPNDNEWNRFLESPLNGRIGMSFALQWRYNFGRVFPATVQADAGGQVVGEGIDEVIVDG